MIGTPQTLSAAEARRVYNFIGRAQDSQVVYEGRFTDALMKHSRFDEARSVVELGCGTGRIARSIVRQMPEDGRYLALDQSTTMVGLAQEKLAPFEGRARVKLTEGGLSIDAPDGSFDRFVSTYVLDLLSDANIQAAIDEAHRLLEEGGLLCLVGATHGHRLHERLVMGAIHRLWRVEPRLIAGCRPVELLPFLEESRWRVCHHEVGSTMGICSEVLVAQKLSLASQGG